MGKNVTISTLPNIGQNYLPKINTSNIFANSLVYDDGSSVLINTTTASAFKLDVNGSIRATSGTLTGALSGTSATFTLANDITLTARSGSASAYTYWSLGRTSSELEIGVAGAANQFFTGTAAGDVIIKANGSSNKLFLGYGSGSPTLTLLSTGAATFSSSVNIASTVTIGGIDGSFLRTYSSTNDQLRWAFINSSTGVFSIQQQGDNYVNQGDRLVINRSGNVAIGTTSVTNKLIVVGSETGTQITTPPIGKFVNTGNSFSKFIIGSDNANYDAVMSMDNNATLANTKLRIYIGNGTTSTAGHSNDQIVLQGNGRVGIGTSSPSGKFDVYTGVGATFRAIYSTNNQVEVSNYNATDGYREMLLGGSPITFYTGTAGGGQITEKMRITSGANFQTARTSEFDNSKELVSNTNTTFLTVTSNSYAVVRVVIEYLATRNNSGTVVYQSGRYVVFYTANVGQHSAYANETLGTSFISWNVSLSANVLTVQANPGAFNNSSAIYFRAFAVCSDAGTSISLT